ncbi:hypothetical protein NGM10_16370 (plasmid) [Halorussus salilacus]|uniref:hypothetical protein n=1 Tax=Halorussus salilacus TaxID=2953750 RepID=UPI00209E8B79|nr:hypothetical protein [Halorussus salilacus]USZ69978.1 hypothetical protein NGM10_16370 [Halorussus salilacus]
MSEPAEPREREADRINWKRTDGGVELYDETNADAWVRMEFVSGIDPARRLYGICDDCGLVAPQRGLPSASMACGNCGAEFETDR